MIIYFVCSPLEKLSDNKYKLAIPSDYFSLDITSKSPVKEASCDIELPLNKTIYVSKAEFDETKNPKVHISEYAILGEVVNTIVKPEKIEEVPIGATFSAKIEEIIKDSGRYPFELLM